MLLTKKIIIKSNSRFSNEILRKLNIDYKKGEEYEIDIKYLNLNSHRYVKVKCDNCGCEKEIKYQQYNRGTENGKQCYFCNKKECINIARKNSNLKKLGVGNVFQLQDIKDKIKTTSLKRWGVENPNQNLEIRKKSIKTNLKRWGVENVFQSEEIKEKIKNTNLKKYGFEYPQQCPEIRSKVKLHVPSKKEKEILNFIKSIYKNTIEISDRKILNGLELDIYLPGLRLAFEFNGLYWHSNIDKNYHKRKTELCEEKYIQLIHIWEDEWDYKQESVKNMIKNKIVYDNYNYKMEFKKIDDDSKIEDYFINNSTKFYKKYDINICCLVDGKITGIICLDENRKNEYCLKFCDNNSKELLNYFIKEYSPGIINFILERSYLLYKDFESIGFLKRGIIEPSFLYVNKKMRVMNPISGYKIYDSGKIKLKYENPKLKYI